MKAFKFYSTLIFIFLNVTLLQAQSMSSEELDQQMKEFQLQTEKWKEAYNSGDAKNLVPLYAENATYVSSHVNGLEAIGRDKLIANFQNGISGGGHIDKIEILSSEIDSDLATLYCRYQATNSGQTFVGRNLLVLRKIEGKWLIVMHMTVV